MEQTPPQTCVSPKPVLPFTWLPCWWCFPVRPGLPVGTGWGDGELLSSQIIMPVSGHLLLFHTLLRRVLFGVERGVYSKSSPFSLQTFCSLFLLISRNSLYWGH